MTLVLQENFDTLTAWSNVNANTTICTGVTGLGVKVTGVSAHLDYAITAPNQSDTIIVGSWINLLSLPAAGQNVFQLYSDTNVTLHNQISIATDGRVTVARAGTVVAQSAIGIITANTAYYLEIQVKLHDTTGTVVVRVNGTEVVNATALDTKNAGTKTVYDTVRLGILNASSGGTCRYDDLYIATGVGETFRGPQRYGTGPNVVLDEQFNSLSNWTTVSGTPALGIGRNGNAAQLTVTSVIGYTIPAPSESYYTIIGFWLSIGSNLAISDFVSFRSDAGATLHANLRVNNDGSITMLRAGSTTVGSAPAGTLTANSSCYFEILYLLHDSGGAVTIRKNGVAVVTSVDVDTRQAGTKTTIDQIRINGIGSATTTFYDDLYIRTGTLADFLGDHSVGGVVSLVGSSAGATTPMAADLGKIVKLTGTAGGVATASATPPIPTPTFQMHGIICSYLGDCELDIGKTSRWLMNFCDTIFFFDATPATINRKYAVDYAKSWPDAEFAAYPSTSTSYFTDPKVMRQAAFQAAKKAWNYQPGDWVFFCDSSESITINVPLEQLQVQTGNATSTFEYLYQEVLTAPAGTDEINTPIKIFLKQGTLVEHDNTIDLQLASDTAKQLVYLQDLLDDTTDLAERADLQAQIDNLLLVQEANVATFWTLDPRYMVNTLASTRLVKVSKLDTDFDYAKIDVYNAVGDKTATKVAVISYAYARWSEVDQHNPAAWTRPNDLGYTSRQYIQTVPGKALVTLPTLDQDYGSPDPAGGGITIPQGPAQIRVYDSVAAVEAMDFEGSVPNPTGSETYDWNFGDATAHATTRLVTHSFPVVAAQSRTYTVTLTVNPGSRVSTVAITIDMTTAGQEHAVIGTPVVTAPAKPVSAMLAPAYCFYLERVRSTLYDMMLTAPWRKNPRDGVWYDEMVIGDVPLNPVTGEPDVGTDPFTNETIPPEYWETQQPIGRSE